MTANGRALRCVGIKEPKLNNPQKHHRSTMLNISTLANILQNPCYMLCFFKWGKIYFKMTILERYAVEISQQVRDGASVSDVMQLLQDFENQNWISISEYLPEFDKPVFVFNSKEAESFGIARIESKTETQNGLSISWLEGKTGYTNWWYDVTHWKPILRFEECLLA